MRFPFGAGDLEAQALNTAQETYNVASRAPVSYTHLEEVDSRTHGSDRFLFANKMCDARFYHIGVSIIAVSCTHLDVYKRQVSRSRFL